MAGRIIPIALATISGVMIATSTFGNELKERQRLRLQKEYNQELAAASALPSDGPSLMSSSTIQAPQPEQIPGHVETTKSSKTSLFGWAWKTKENTGNIAKEQTPAKPSVDASTPKS